MWRFLAGVAASLLLVTGGLVWWRGSGQAADAIPPAPPARYTEGGGQPAPVDDPPSASPKTREEKRFGRYDKDKDGAVGRAEYLASRQKAYAKLDLNGDGRLSFEEYAVKTVAKFAAADKDRSARLTPDEFVLTRVIRKPGRTRRDCPPPATTMAAAEED